MARTLFDPKLIERARDGDASAVNAVLERLKPLFQAFFDRNARDRFRADDLVQNALLRVHKGLPDLVHADRFRSFAMKAAMFELHDMYRGRYSSKEHLPDPEKSPPVAGPSSSHAAGLSLDVERALKSLSPRARRIIELKEYGYRYREIAVMLDTTEAAVKMQVKRAFANMRAALTD